MSRDVESSVSDFEQYRSYVYKLCQLPKRQRPTMREMLSDESMYSEPDDQTEATVAQLWLKRTVLTGFGLVLLA